ncbi:Conserved_hypothetical protein [Hexamita inflata]|uniref:Chaoptin n=1 Tax=Hexamita inflata TaxID=28002 RepID=A0AA86NQ11_9EUKA|nr:Conserved hypothetical protein [Hexamita inflata]
MTNFENSFKITNITELIGLEIKNQEKIWIENILHTKLDLVPVNVKHLTIRFCNLLSLKGLENIISLEYLDVSGNTVYSLHDIVVHKQLKTLIIQNTQIIEVSQVLQLPNLTKFNAANSYIVDSLPLINHPNFEVKWITPQKIASLTHFQLYLHLLNDSVEAEQMMQDQLANKQESDYMIKMVKRYASQVENGKLEVDDDQDVTHFRFMDCIKATSVIFNKCYNINFESTPKQLKELAITNSKLTSIDGVQKITNLERVDFSNNNIIFIDPIKTLIGLKQVFVDGNHIHDLQIILDLPHFQGNAFQMQTAPTDEVYKQCLGSSYSYAKVKELKTLFQKYLDSDTVLALLSQFQQSIQNKTLKIVEHSLQSIQFFDRLEIDELNLQLCKNLNLQVTPKKVKRLIINNCFLSTVKINGLEIMTQLTELNLGQNLLTDDSLEFIGNMKNLKILDLSLNKLENVDKLKTLTNLKSLDLNQNFIKTIDGLETLIELENLDISYNQVTQINQLDNMVNIKILNISHNKISTIMSLQNMTAIVYLDISFNLILSVEICKDFKMLVDLRTQKNKIQDFSTIMSHSNCKQSWQSEQNEISDKDYVNAGLITRQITNLKMSQKYHQNNDAMLKKYQYKIFNNEVVINNDNEVMNLLFADVYKAKKITIEGCQNIIFDMVPIYVQILIVKNSNLKHISNIYQMEQITDLILSGNEIHNIFELGALINLKRLDLSSNDIYNIESLKELANLQYLDISNNKILFCEPLKDLNIIELIIKTNLIYDLEYITKMKFFQFKLTTYPKLIEPSLSDFQKYLGENLGTAEAAQQLIDSNKENHRKMLQIVDNIHIFTRLLIDGSINELTIENEPNLTSIQLVDEQNIAKVSIKQCNNLRFDSVPRNVTELIVNDCQLYDINGIEQMTQLQVLNLNNNNLLFIQTVSALINLEQFSAASNLITDFTSIKSLPNFKYRFISPQRTPQNSDYELYLSSTNSRLALNELQIQIQTNERTNVEFIKQASLLNEYDIKMTKKYQKEQKEQKGILKIKKDPELCDLFFADSYNIDILEINKSINVNFFRTPVNVVKLTINKCELTKIDGIEKMTQLIYLSLAINQISNIEPLRTLTNLTELYLDENKITKIKVIEPMMQLTKLSLFQNSISDLEPLRTMRNIKELVLATNKIYNIEPLRGLHGIIYLNLMNNYIQDMSPANQLPNRHEIDSTFFLIFQQVPTVQFIAQWESQ